MPSAPSRRTALLSLLLGAAGAARGRSEAPALLQVGPTRAVRSLAEAARLARAGMRIEVDAGDYVSDVASWGRDGLSLRAIGGRVRLLPRGAHAQGKGIFVVAGDGVEIEGFDFIGASAPDGNGAGIRFERGSLRVRDCLFSHCEMGLLSNNDAAARLTVEDCEFAHAPARAQGRPAHLLYAGAIARLEVSGCHFHHGRTGHLIKSRAALNLIRYNRLDDAEGSASYELEFPNGGLALVLGNVIVQGPRSENPHLLAFGAEGYRPGQAQGLWLVHNTLVDGLPAGGRFLRAAPGPLPARLLNNLLVGPGLFDPAPAWESRGNERAAALRPGPALRGRLVDPGPLPGPEGTPLRPERQPRTPLGSVALAGPARYPGALQAD